MTTKMRSRFVQPTQPDVTAAAGAFEEIQPEAAAIPPDQVVGLRVNPQLAAAFASSIAKRDSEPARYERLAVLNPTGLFHTDELGRLEKIALATFHARRRHLESSELSSGARVPEATLRTAQERRTRMLRVLDHYVGHLPEHAARLTAIRSGSGYQDLANDLLALHDDYVDPDIASLISRDPVHFRTDDAKRAAAQAMEIFTGLGLTAEGEAQSWKDLTDRCATLLLDAYDSVTNAGKFVFHKTEDVDVTYPSLISAVRAARTRGSSGGEEEGDEETGDQPTLALS